MKNMYRVVFRLAAVLALALALSGCALGGRLRATPTPEPSQVGQSQPAAPTANPQAIPTLSGKPVSPAAQAATPAATTDTQGGDLLKLISTLDAANQAGDPLDNLP